MHPEAPRIVSGLQTVVIGGTAIALETIDELTQSFLQRLRRFALFGLSNPFGERTFELGS